MLPVDEFDGLANVHAVTISPDGDLFVGEYDGGKIMLMELGKSEPQRTLSAPSTMWSMAAASDGKSLFAGSGSGTNARVYRVPLAEGSSPTEEVWAAKSDGVGVFLAIVERLTSAATKQ